MPQSKTQFVWFKDSFSPKHITQTNDQIDERRAYFVHNICFGCYMPCNYPLSIEKPVGMTEIEHLIENPYFQLCIVDRSNIISNIQQIIYLLEISLN